MATYRMIKRTPLSTGQVEGDLISENVFKAQTLKTLVDKGVLVLVSMPPLAELPGWSIRAEKLAKLGVITIDDLLDADEGKLREIRGEFHYKTNVPIDKWKSEAMMWLKPAAKAQPKRG